MNRRSETTSFESEWSSPASGTTLNADSRWTIVSTSVSALIVGSIAWLAVSTIPPVTGGSVENASRGFLPYRLFQQLTQAGSDALFANVNANPDLATPTAPLSQPLQAERVQKPKSSIETRTVTLDAGDTLAGALESAGISADDANAAISALSKVYSPRSLKAGLAFDIAFNTKPDVSDANNPASDNDANGDISKARSVSGEPSARLLSIRFSPTIDHDIAVTRGADGTFQATDVVKQLVARAHRAGSTIDGSLYSSAQRAGIPMDVVNEMGKMFSYKVDLQRDLHPGDSFEVFYNYYYTPEGSAAKKGTIDYAVMRLGGKQIVLYRYQPDPNVPAEYFDASGESAKGLLMKTPVDGARITSGFGMRFHPVLGYSRMHKGVDFGVPIGTPVMAAGGGSIAFMGWESGYGRFVLINHGNGYSTAYGHLSRFAPGLHVGSRVGQAQIVAYSGNTGLATGPHLHYEIRQNTKQVNPLSIKMAQGRKLAGKELRAFQSERLKIDDLMASTKLETKIADGLASNNRR